MNVSKIDLVIELVRVTQHLGYPPSPEEVTQHTKYSYQQYEEEFGDLLQALKQTGVFPESATQSDLEELTGRDTNFEVDKSQEAADVTHLEHISEISTRNFAELTGFKRDVLIVVSGLNEPKGLEIKEEIEEYYNTEVHHGRLYPNLDELAEQGYLEKFSHSGRSNGYRVTERGKVLIYSRIGWERNHWDKKSEQSTNEASLNQLGEKRSEASCQDDESSSGAVDDTSVDKAEFIEEINKFADVLGEPPTEELIEEYSDYSIADYRTAFGSWEKALNEAGYNIDEITINKTDLLEEINKFADVLGEPPTEELIEEYSDYSIADYRTAFESWEKALEQIDCRPAEDKNANEVQDNIDYNKLIDQELEDIF